MEDMAVISGVGDSTYAFHSGRTPVNHMSEALGEALEDAGLEPGEIDGTIVEGGLDYDLVATNFGLNVRYSLQTWSHGRFTGPIIATAAAVVQAGLANNVLCIHARSGVSQFGGANDREAFREGGGPHGELSHYGITAPASGAALAWRRYVAMYDADPEALRHVVVPQRGYAALNPNAVLKGKPLSEAEYLKDRLIIEPLRRADFALPNDGSIAIIVSGAREAREGTRILGTQGLKASRQEVAFGNPGMGLGYQDSTTPVSEEHPVFARSGIAREKIDLLCIYDSFSPQVVFELERFGYCPYGTGWKWLAEGRPRRNGALRVNSSGGHIAEAGLSGWNHLVEIHRQLHGKCGERQVPSPKFAQYIGPGACSIIFGGPN